jgi:dTDP-4-amino-4,6-dideoxygalactose transaminase
VDKYTWVDLGSSYLPSDIIAAFLFAQMENAEQIVARRNLIFDLYWEGLRPLAEKGHIQLPCVLEDCRSNGHIFYILTGSLEERTKLTAHLQKQGIMAVFHYVPLHSSPAGMRFGRTSGSMKWTERAGNCLLRLPLYYEMTDSNCRLITESITRFYEHP